jgi:hypothetical protein
MNDHFLPEEWITPAHQIDDIEPVPKASDAIRDARVKCVFLLNAVFSHIESALLRPGAGLKDVAVAVYQPAYAIGAMICDGLSMTERAEFWGVERASISKGATAFCAGNAMPPSFYMKKEEAQSSYRDARVGSIKKCNQKKSKLKRRRHTH